MNKANEERRLRKAKEFSIYVKETREYELLSEYKTVNEYVTIKHLTCGNVYNVRPSHFKTRGQRCKQCTRKDDREKSEKKLLDLMKDEYILLSKYKNNKTQVKVKHTVYGHIYNVKPDNFFHGRRCPKCKSSKGERIVREFLIENNIQYKEQFKIKECKNIRPLPFDFAIFKNNKLLFLIEYQGQQHYVKSDLFGEYSFRQTKINDSIKRQYCKSNNIELLEIPYWIKDIEKFLRDRLLK